MEPGWRDIVYWSQIIIQRPHKKKATQDQLPFPSQNNIYTQQHFHMANQREKDRTRATTNEGKEAHMGKHYPHAPNSAPTQQLAQE